MAAEPPAVNRGRELGAFGREKVTAPRYSPLHGSRRAGVPWLCTPPAAARPGQVEPVEKGGSAAVSPTAAGIRLLVSPGPGGSAGCPAAPAGPDGGAGGAGAAFVPVLPACGPAALPRRASARPVPPAARRRAHAALCPAWFVIVNGRTIGTSALSSSIKAP